jgi:RimJ/RimL family protein N-acetyltransferase
MVPTINYKASLLSTRLRLVPVMCSHAEEMFRVLSDDGLYVYTGGCPPKSVADLGLWFSELESRKSPDGSELWLTWLLFTVESGEAIGYVQATVGRSQADIAWLVGSNWQGIGYASEAAATLTSWLVSNNLDMITAHIHPHHIGSQWVAKVAGLRNSGRIEDGEEVWVSAVALGHK